MRYSAVGWVGLAILLGLLGFLGYRQLQQADTAIDGAPPGGSFVLQGAAGDVSLTDFRGKLVLIYFGYSFCPDICPMSLSAITMAFNRLAPEELAQVQGIFVSVDPARDSVERVEQYA